MMLDLLLAALVVQQPPTPPPTAVPASPVADIIITPARGVVTPGDTIRFRAEPRDSAGQPVANVRIMFRAAGGRFEGSVDTTGLVSAGATGTIPVAVIALVPGTKPFIKRTEVRIVAGPAAWIAVAPRVPKLVAGQRVRLTARVTSEAGDARSDTVTWRSSNRAIVRVDGNGVVTAVAPGRATVTVGAGAATERVSFEIVPNTIASVDIQPKSAKLRQGDVVQFTARALTAAGREIPGLTPSWSFAPGQGEITEDGNFVAYETGDYLVTASFGKNGADVPVSVEARNVRRPVEIVGRLPRSLFTTEEVWIHPNGRIAYLGTGSGGDRMYAIDISDPAKPVVTDSIVANTRRVNDIMTTPDGRFLVFTREGAADRKNGIVIAQLEDPAHPKPIAEFTEGVTAGVHSAFVYRQEKFGTHVYITNDGTGALHVIDINDPYHPKEVAQWRTPRADAGRTLHDVDIQDGLAYLSYWNDGLVILDVGNGMAGGSPSNPQLVSQYKYDLNALYRDVELRHGPGFIRGTHTAWRHGHYVFIADEVFPAGQVEGAKDAAAFRAFGRLQVLDVSDLKHPKSVAWYEPEYGGVHNVWVAGDTLYLGAYNAGFHAFDVSGELLGDLRAQQREIAHVHTGDMDGNVKNTPMTWGVVVSNGLAYVNDMFNGLWIVRIKPPLDAKPVP
ncbi:MAG TPA: Ig-like domain-containing protein [Gemmatimonadales bacterium]|nr:Ig-like domain-containing protein [Gemmatimonadales bacterium]